jgi:aldehyde:ferredoxin oxidoreductase
VTVASGWIGRRVRVDLTKGQSLIEEIDRSHLETWLGGRGLNSRLLYSEVCPDVDSSSP